MNRFIDGGLLSGSNNGVDLDNAYQSISAGFSSFSITEPTYTWIRRRSIEYTSAQINLATSGGSQSKAAYYIACPRSSITGTGNFEQGSRVVTGVSFSCELLKHVARNIKNDLNGNWNLITAIAYKISLSNITGEFTFGNYDSYIVGNTTGATGKVHKASGADLWIVLQGDTAFQIGETITGPDGEGTVTAINANDGFILLRRYTGETASNANLTIKEDDFKDIWDAIDDSEWVIKKSEWESDPHDLPQIYLTSTNRLEIGAYYSLLQGIYLSGGGGAGSGAYRAGGFGHICKNNIIANANQNCYHATGSNGGRLINSVVIHNKLSAYNGVKIENQNHRIINSAIYNGGKYSVEGTTGYHAINSNFGVELSSAQQDLQLQNGQAYIYDCECGNTDKPLRTSTYDDFTCRYKCDNWQRVYGQSYQKISNGSIEYVNVNEDSDPVQRPNGSDFVAKIVQNEKNLYFPDNSLWEKILWTTPINFTTTGEKTLRLYLQNDGLSLNDGTEPNIWLDVQYPNEYQSKDLYTIDTDGVFFKRGLTPNINQRSSVSDWTNYLEITFDLPTACTVIVNLKSRFYGNGYLIVDPKIEVV